MGKINPYRMLGRIIHLAGTLMSVNKLKLMVMPEVTELFRHLSENVEPADRQMCLECIDLYSKYLEQGRALNLPQKEIKRLKSEGFDEGKLIYSKYPDHYYTYLFSDQDFLPEYKKRRFRRNCLYAILAAVSVAIVSGIIAYNNMPYFKEIRAYESVKKANDNVSAWTLNEKVMEYIRAFPEGKHLDDVMMMPVDHALQYDANANEKYDAAETYLIFLPDGQHAAECRQIISDLWDEEIAKYQYSVGTPTEATESVANMLRYMKSENTNIIDVAFNTVFDVKSFDDYPDNIKRLTESQYSNLSNFHIVGNVVLPEDYSDWEYPVLKSIRNGFDALLTPGFIDIRNANVGNVPTIFVTFTVKTKEDRHGCPELWFDRPNPHSVFAVVGIRVDIDVKILLPNTGEEYNYTYRGECIPTDYNNFFNTYVKVIKQDSEIFAKDLTKQLGLPPA